MGDRIIGIIDKRLAGERLSFEDGVTLLQEADLLNLGQAANKVRKIMHPENAVTFVIDRNINYTNICICQCKFCAFYRQPDDPEGYILNREESHTKIAETLSLGGTQLLIQGGLHPDLGLEYFEEMLKDIKSHFNIHVHSFSPPEIWDLATKSGLDIEEVIKRLKNAGLDSIAGGGAEILVDRVRRFVSPNKIGWRKWMDVMQAAHRLGMKSSATMVFGHVETLEERILHMIRIREAQDETGGFTAFIPFTYAPKNTALGGTSTTGVDYLRTLAVSRLMLDNVPNIQVSWPSQGTKMAQVALWFGANDFGSTMLEENVMRAAGVQTRVPLQEIILNIKDAGYIAVQRNTHYDWLKTY